MDKDFGEIQPPQFGKRWTMPWAEMEEGDCFHVRQLWRSKGSISNVAHVTAQRLGVKFSVVEHPDKPGYTLVTRRRPGRGPKSKTHMVSYRGMIDYLVEFYDMEGRDQIESMVGPSLFSHPDGREEQDRRDVHWVKEPPLKEFTLAGVNNPVLVELRPGEIVMTGKQPGFELEAWKAEQLLAD